ncbi:hypothetical protein GCM10009080_55530 [Cupriavidus pauculus]
MLVGEGTRKDTSEEEASERCRAKKPHPHRVELQRAGGHAYRDTDNPKDEAVAELTARATECDLRMKPAQGQVFQQNLITHNCLLTFFVELLTLAAVDASLEISVVSELQENSMCDDTITQRDSS